MRYSLVIYKSNSEFMEITDYSTIPGFQHIDEKTLDGIVTFTNMFNNKEELILFLAECNLISADYLNGTFGINYYKNKTKEMYKTLQYGISFAEDKQYFDITFIAFYFKDRMNNPKFIKAFLDKYYLYLKKVPIFSEELNFINYSYNYLTTHGNLPPNASEAMFTFVKNYCRKKDFKPDFRKIRDLAMFAINYERLHERKTQTPTISDTELLINHYKTLINNGVSNDEREIYEEEIRKLEDKLKIEKQITLSRSR